MSGDLSKPLAVQHPGAMYEVRWEESGEDGTLLGSSRIVSRRKGWTMEGDNIQRDAERLTYTEMGILEGNPCFGSRPLDDADSRTTQK